MKVRFLLNNEEIDMNLNSNQPLNYTLMELNSKSNRYLSCNGKDCGLCIVLDRKNDEIIQSCLTPMFRLQGADIITPDYFFSQKVASYVKVAYKDVNMIPCDECIQKRTLLFDWIANVLETKTVKVNNQKDSAFYQQMEKVNDTRPQSPREKVQQYKDFILSTHSLIKCNCMTPGDILSITEAVLQRRRH